MVTDWFALPKEHNLWDDVKIKKDKWEYRLYFEKLEVSYNK